MKRLFAPTAIAAIMLANTSYAQDTAAVDCNDPANAGLPACTGLPEGLDVTNVVPLVAPIAGIVALGVLAGGGGGDGGSTPATPSTPSTPSN